MNNIVIPSGDSQIAWVKWHTPSEPQDIILLENVPGLAPTSLLLLEQLRTIDRKRLRGYIGRISTEKMLEVDAALAISIGIGYPNERRTHNV